MKIRKLMTAVALAAATASASATTFVSFVIDGDTFLQPFSITNQSTAMETITAIHFDLSPSGMVFDTVNGGVPNNTNAKPFTPRNAAQVGLLTPSSVADGASVLNMTFNDFNGVDFVMGTAAETFQWDIDVDSADGTRDTILGRELAGATMWVDFSNGERLFGQLVRDCAAFDTQGNCIRYNRVDASVFSLVGRTPIPNPNPNPTPEPGSLALAGLALLALGAARKGRRQG